MRLFQSKKKKVSANCPAIFGTNNGWPKLSQLYASSGAMPAAPPSAIHGTPRGCLASATSAVTATIGAGNIDVVIVQPSSSPLSASVGGRSSASQSSANAAVRYELASTSWCATPAYGNAVLQTPKPSAASHGHQRDAAGAAQACASRYTHPAATAVARDAVKKVTRADVKRKLRW